MVKTVMLSLALFIQEDQFQHHTLGSLQEYLIDYFQEIQAAHNMLDRDRAPQYNTGQFSRNVAGPNYSDGQYARTRPGPNYAISYQRATTGPQYDGPNYTSQFTRVYSTNYAKNKKRTKLR